MSPVLQAKLKGPSGNVPIEVFKGLVVSHKIQNVPVRLPEELQPGSEECSVSPRLSVFSTDSAEEETGWGKETLK